MVLITTSEFLTAMWERISDYKAVYVFTKENEKINIKMATEMINFCFDRNNRDAVRVFSYTEKADMAFRLGTLLKDDVDYSITDDVIKLPDYIISNYKITYIKADTGNSNIKGKVTDKGRTAKADASVNTPENKGQSDKEPEKTVQADDVKPSGPNILEIVSANKDEGIIDMDTAEDKKSEPEKITDDKSVPKRRKTGTKINADAPANTVNKSDMPDEADEKARTDVKSKAVSDCDAGKEQKTPATADTEKIPGRRHRTPVKKENDVQAAAESQTAVAENGTDDIAAKQGKTEKIFAPASDMSDEDKKIMDFLQVSGLRATHLPVKQNIKDKAFGKSLLKILSDCDNDAKKTAGQVINSYGKSNVDYIMAGIERYLDFMDID